MNDKIKKLLFVSIILFISLLFSGNFHFSNKVFTSPDENIIISLSENILDGEYSLGDNKDFELRGTKFINGKITSGKFFGFSLYLAIFQTLTDYRIIYIITIISSLLGILFFFKELTKNNALSFSILIPIIVLPILFLWYSKGIMEHPIAISMLFWGLFLLEKKYTVLGFIFLGLMCFYRPDYFLIFIVFYIFFIIKNFNIKYILISGISSLFGVGAIFGFNKIFYGGYLKMGPSVLYEDSSNSSIIPIGGIDGILGNLINLKYTFIFVPTFVIGLFLYKRLDNSNLKRYFILFFISFLLVFIYVFISGGRLSEQYDISFYRYLLPFEIFFSGVFFYTLLKKQLIKNELMLYITYILIILIFLNTSLNYFYRNFYSRNHYNSLIEVVVENHINEKDVLVLTDYLDKVFNPDFNVIYLNGKGNIENNIKLYYEKYKHTYDIFIVFGNKPNFDFQSLDGYKIEKISSGKQYIYKIN